MTKPQTIQWQTHESGDIQGLINEKEIFTIKAVGKKQDTYNLVSWPITSELFHKSAINKTVGNFDSPEKAKQVAQEKFDEYVMSLFEKVVVEV